MGRHGKSPGVKQTPGLVACQGRNEINSAMNSASVMKSLQASSRKSRAPLTRASALAGSNPSGKDKVQLPSSSRPREPRPVAPGVVPRRDGTLLPRGRHRRPEVDHRPADRSSSFGTQAGTDGTADHSLAGGDPGR